MKRRCMDDEDVLCARVMNAQERAALAILRSARLMDKLYEAQLEASLYINEMPDSPPRDSRAFAVRQALPLEIDAIRESMAKARAWALESLESLAS